MSDITLDTKGSDFLKLAQEFGVNLNNDMSSNLYSGNGGSKYTGYHKPKNIRSIFDAHKLDGVIKWTEQINDGNPANRTAEVLYKKDPNGGEPREISGIIEMRGIVVNYQQKDELRYFDGEKTQTLCSVIGYRQDKKLVKKLPETPYGMKHSFVQNRATKKWSVDFYKPNNAVELLDLVGFRGERPTSCVDCIRAGQSTEMIPEIGENGSGKTIVCEPRGRLFMAVFEVVIKTKSKSSGEIKGKSVYVDSLESLPIKDLVNLDNEAIGDYLLIEVPLSKSSVKGSYVKGLDGKKDVDKSVDGYEAYVRNLIYTYKDERSPLRQPIVHQTSLTYKKNPYAPTFQANFASLGTANIEWFKQAVIGWKEQLPTKTIEEIEVEPIQAIDPDGTINIKPVVFEDDQSVESTGADQVSFVEKKESLTRNGNVDESEDWDDLPF